MGHYVVKMKMAFQIQFKAYKKEHDSYKLYEAFLPVWNNKWLNLNRNSRKELNAKIRLNN